MTAACSIVRTGLLMSWGVIAWAQAVSTSQIQGVVQDATGLAVEGAQVRATQTATGATRLATTSADGTYVLPNLPVGPYRLEVSKEGFNQYVQTGILLQVGSNPNIDVQLKVGVVTEQVSVEADAAMVETQATGVGNVMENQRILDLPLNGRNPADLIQLTGSAVAPGGFTTLPAAVFRVKREGKDTRSPAARLPQWPLCWMAPSTTTRSTI